MTGQRALERKLADTHSLLVAAQGHRREELVQLRRLERDLARAHAHHMFGVDVDGPPADRVGALHYLRAHGLPEATTDDLDAACEGLVTPWGPRPAQSFPSIAYDSCEGRGTLPGGRPCPGCRGCWGR